MTAKRSRTPSTLINSVLPKDMVTTLILEMDEHYAEAVREMKHTISDQVQVNVLRWQQDAAIRRASR